MGGIDSARVLRQTSSVSAGCACQRHNACCTALQYAWLCNDCRSRCTVIQRTGGEMDISLRRGCLHQQRDHLVFQHASASVFNTALWHGLPCAEYADQCCERRQVSAPQPQAHWCSCCSQTSSALVSVVTGGHQPCRTCKSARSTGAARSAASSSHIRAGTTSCSTNRSRNCGE